MDIWKYKNCPLIKINDGSKNEPSAQTPSNRSSSFSPGDASAMDRLYAVYADYLAGVCARYIADDDDLKDVLQESSSRFSPRWALRLSGQRVAEGLDGPHRGEREP
jgi:hypothetical protein